MGESGFDFTDTYAVKLLSSDYDKRLIRGFVMAVDNSVDDEKRGTTRANYSKSAYQRKLAKLYG